MDAYDADFEFDEIRSQWALDVFQRRHASPSTSSSEDDGLGEERVNFQGIALSASPTYDEEGAGETSDELQRRDEYLAKLHAQVLTMQEWKDYVSADHEIFVRELNHNSNKFISYPDLHLEPGVEVPESIMEIYWNMHGEAYKRRQMQFNNYLGLHPNSFLRKPKTEYRAMLNDIAEEDCEDSTDKSATDEDCPFGNLSFTNNDASRKSRVKKRITTELLIESHEHDMKEEVQLQDDEAHLQTMIAILEDMVFDITGNVRLLHFYRNKASVH